MRASDEIGDDAFHRIEEELDWIEMASGESEKWIAIDERVRRTEDQHDGGLLFVLECFGAVALGGRIA